MSVDEEFSAVYNQYFPKNVEDIDGFDDDVSSNGDDDELHLSQAEDEKQSFNYILQEEYFKIIMFDVRRLSYFKLYIQQAATKTMEENENIFEVKRYAYVEDRHDIVSLHNVLYDSQPTANASGAIITVWQANRSGFPNNEVFALLKYSFSIQAIIVHDNGPIDFIPIFFGKNFMSLLPVGGLTMERMLLPTTKSYDQIFINDLSMKGSPTYFIDLFHPHLWLSFLFAFTVIGLVSEFGKYLVRKYKPSNDPKDDSFNCIALITNQGGELSTFTFQNIVLLSLSILVIIFHGAFESFMSSSLAIRMPDLPFSDLNSLYRLKDYTICTVLFSQADYEITNIIRTGGSFKPKLNTQECPKFLRVSRSSYFESDVVDACPDGKFAYLGFESVLTDAVMRKCNLKPLPEKIFQSYVTILVSPGFEYREQFNQRIIRFRTAGHLDIITKYYKILSARQSKFLLVGSNNLQQLSDDLDSIGFFQVTLVFTLLCIGMICSLMMFAIERLVRHVKMRRQGKSFGMRGVRVW